MSSMNNKVSLKGMLLPAYLVLWLFYRAFTGFGELVIFLYASYEPRLKKEKDLGDGSAREVFAEQASRPQFVVLALTKKPDVAMCTCHPSVGGWGQKQIDTRSWLSS